MATMRYICIHGHFYQPVRENPWTGTLPLAPEAYPYHDWNDRICAQAYGPNAWSQIRDSHDRVSEIVDNYERISFNFGPTLLCWLDEHAPEVYRAVLSADKASQVRFSGHGSAMAQCYNHMIMPLANARDKKTQVAWGIRDFRFHSSKRAFGYPPSLPGAFAIGEVDRNLCVQWRHRPCCGLRKAPVEWRPIRNAASLGICR
jgi:alpha-amylase/alpha-mannosidase (GH57 family)